MNKKKILLSVLVLAVLAFSSAAATIVHASTSPPWSSYSQMPWYINSLVTPGTLTVAGSSTIGPIASAEIAGTDTANPTTDNFVSYWNNLVSENPSWGTSSALDLSAVSLSTLGSGTAIPALDGTGGTADVGEMSRPPQDAEWANTAMTNMQIWAVGVDSVAIVVSPDMTWFPTSLNTFQVAELFADSNPTNQQGQPGYLSNGGDQGLLGATGSTPLYATWDDFLNANGFSANAQAAGAAGNQPIQLAVRDPTSGTFDCFNNYFAVPNGYSFEYKGTSNGIGTPGQPGYVPPSNGQSTVIGTQEMAPFIYCEENGDVISLVSDGNYGSTGDFIGFVSLGYALSNPPTGTAAGDGVIPLNIAFNMASPPSGKTASPTITYYGPSGTFGATTNPAYTGYSVYDWGQPVQPTDPNVIWAYSGVEGSAATGQYEAWRWLWEVTPGPIPSTGPCLAAGVWIAYMMEDGTTLGGTANFVQDQYYIPLCRADMAGATPIDSNLVTSGTINPSTGTPYFTVTQYQTQTIPDGQVNGHDFFYFVNAYINYYSQGIYNPYADINADGVINGHDFFGFVNAYIGYYTTYNPS